MESPRATMFHGRSKDDSLKRVTLKPHGTKRRSTLPYDTKTAFRISKPKHARSSSGSSEIDATPLRIRIPARRYSQTSNPDLLTAIATSPPFSEPSIPVHLLDEAQSTDDGRRSTSKGAVVGTPTHESSHSPDVWINADGQPPSPKRLRVEVLLPPLTRSSCNSGRRSIRTDDSEVSTAHTDGDNAQPLAEEARFLTSAVPAEEEESGHSTAQLPTIATLDTGPSLNDGVDENQSELSLDVGKAVSGKFSPNPESGESDIDEIEVDQLAAEETTIGHSQPQDRHPDAELAEPPSYLPTDLALKYPSTYSDTPRPLTRRLPTGEAHRDATTPVPHHDDTMSIDGIDASNTVPDVIIHPGSDSGSGFSSRSTASASSLDSIQFEFGHGHMIVSREGIILDRSPVSPSSPYHRAPSRTSTPGSSYAHPSSSTFQQAETPCSSQTATAATSPLEAFLGGLTCEPLIHLLDVFEKMGFITDHRLDVLATEPEVWPQVAAAVQAKSNLSDWTLVRKGLELRARRLGRITAPWH